MITFVIDKETWVEYNVKDLDVAMIPRPLLGKIERRLDDLNDEWYQGTQQLTIKDISFSIPEEVADGVDHQEKLGYLSLIIDVIKYSPNYRKGMKFYWTYSGLLFPKGTWREFFDRIKL